MQIQAATTISTSSVINSFSNEPASTKARPVPGETGDNFPAVQVPENAVQANASAKSKEEVESAVNKLNSVASALGQSIQFSVDSDTKQNIVKLVDRESNKVIRQIPTEEAVTIAKAIDRFQGLLIKDKV